jgi:fatty acid desaturase
MDYRTFLKDMPDACKVALTQKDDWRGLRHAISHFGLIGIVGWAIAIGAPFWPLLIVVQGVLIVFLFTLAHEATHLTPFKTRWLNEAAGHFCGFLLILPFYWFRPFHMAHHRWTNLQGQDPEMDAPKPETFTGWLWHISGFPFWGAMIALLFRLVRGVEAPDYLGKRTKPKAEKEARIMLVLYIAIAVFSVFDPVLIWVWIIPAIVGQPALRLYLMAEHGDCQQVTDMFANTRTVFTTRIMRFLAWNMPYHTEHHVWPQVPFHQLPALHLEMREHLQVTSAGYAAFTQNYLAQLRSSGQTATQTGDTKRNMQ